MQISAIVLCTLSATKEFYRCEGATKPFPVWCSIVKNKYCVDFSLFQAVQRPKSEQQLVIQNIVQGKDVYTELPTGFDKSLSLQVWMLWVCLCLSCLTFSCCCFTVGFHNERSDCLAPVNWVWGGIYRRMWDQPTRNYWAERGRSISFLEARKFSLRKDSWKCLRYVCDKNNRCMFFICQFEQYEINTLIDIAWHESNWACNPIRRAQN